MFEQLHRLLTDLDTQLTKIGREETDHLLRASKSVQSAKDSCYEFIATAKKEKKLFKGRDDYLHFFKQLKIPLYSKLFFHTDLYNIEVNCPPSPDKAKRKYLKDQLYRISGHFNNHRNIYEYYRLKATKWDEQYFAPIKELDAKYDENGNVTVCMDELSSTHDILFARVAANDLLEKHLRKELDYLNGDTGSELNGLHGRLIWTGSKSSMIELIYAVYCTGNINEGRTDIKEIAEIVEFVFKINLGDFYRTYVDLRLRSNRTKFLDEMKAALEAKMNEDDERNTNDSLLKR